jgi:hypothetical protein
MIVVRTRKAGIVLGILVVVIGWAFKATMFLRWVEHGLISVMSFLLLFCAAISLLVGALLVQSGKRGSVTFLLHIVFATLACLSTHFLFVVPLALGIIVTISALVWPASAQQGIASKAAAELV